MSDTAKYTTLEIVKENLGENEMFSRFIPLITCVLWAAAGALGFYFIPGVVTADNIVPPEAGYKKIASLQPV